MIRAIGGVTLLLLMSFGIFGQTVPRVAFEAAAIKPTAGDPSLFESMQNTSARFTARSISVRALIIYAYRVLNMQISGGPNWLATEKFDIEAKKPDASAGGMGINRDDQLSLMLQSLLADRFGLVFHHEKKELPVYSLVVSKGGAKLTKAAAGSSQGTFKGVGRGQTASGLTFFGNEASMADLAHALPGDRVDRYVVDATGLKGIYNFTVEYSRTPDSDGPTIFEAIEKQLGLKLEAGKTPVDILVIDHVDKTPSEN